MATGRPIDHVVLAVRDLDRAAALYETAGFTLTPRALRDDRMGTSNRLIQFPRPELHRRARRGPSGQTRTA